MKTHLICRFCFSCKLLNNSLYIGTIWLYICWLWPSLRLEADLFRVSYLSIKAAQRLDQVCGPAYMKDWRGAALLPFADAIIETQQVGKTFWVLKCWECCSLLWALLKMTRFLIKSSWNNKCPFVHMHSYSVHQSGVTWHTSHGKPQSNVLFNSTLAITSRE